MGMSAGQARLLSVTARLTDNELRSQMLTNSKLRLADKSSEASSKYMDALNSEKLTFKSYSGDGTVTNSNLTPALLYTYQSLKNQYAIRNASGQYLVSGTDAKNYEQSDTLYDFLNCYGLVDNTLYEQYEKDKENYNVYLDEYEKYLEYLADYNQYLKDYADYEAALTRPDLYAEFSNIVGKSDAPKSCYSNALSGANGCYIHVLAHLLDYEGGDTVSKTAYTASNGKQTTPLIDSQITSSALHTDGLSAQFQPISEMLDDTSILCDGDDDSANFDSKENIIQSAIDSGRTPTEFEILRSDYIYDAATNSVTGIKTLKQKTIDLLYILQHLNDFVTNGDISAEDQSTIIKETLINFTDGDMRKLTPQEPPKLEVVPEPEVVEEPVKPAYDIIVNDSEKAQWYINLWYMMNGSESANKVGSGTNDDGTTYYGIANNEKNEANSNYKEIDANLLTSSEWLQFALTNGLVTLSQATYYNPSVNGGKQPDMSAEGYTWSSIIYTSASDIVAQEDEVAIAKAEVEYENAVREIENEDKKIDQDLKKLDTEHNALQTEYDSIKSVIDKNVERSFKAFS